MATQETSRPEQRPDRIVENVSAVPATPLIDALSAQIDHNTLHTRTDTPNSEHHNIREKIQELRHNFRDRFNPPRRKTTQEEIDSRFDHLVAERRKVNAPEIIDTFKKDIQFAEVDAGITVAADPIGMLYPDRRGKRIPYMERLEKAKKDSGFNEAVQIGTAEIGGTEAVVAFMDMRFLGGSFGGVASEKLMRAVDLAMGRRRISENNRKETVIDNEFGDDNEQFDTSKQKPLVIVWNSGGARQQEGFEALTAMPDMVAALHDYKQNTQQPYLSFLVGDVFGGASASGVPLGDVVGAIKYSNMGFAGERVMLEGESLNPGDQSAERRALQTREVDIILEDEQEMFAYCAQTLRVLAGNKPELKRNGKVHVYESTALPTEKLGFVTDFPKPGEIREAQYTEVVFMENKQEGDMYKTFERLVQGTERPTTHDLIKMMFGENYVPLSSECRLPDGYVIRPAIEAAYARDEYGDLYLIIGHNPTELQQDTMNRRLSSSPTPDDLVYARRKLKQAQRLDERLTVISFVDTPGAKATKQTEQHRISLEIAENMAAAWDTTSPIITVVNGLFGSGGGMATGWALDAILATEESQLYVAEPTSTAKIISSVTVENVREIIQTSAVTPRQQMHLGNIDEVIAMPPGGSDKNPLGLAKNIKTAIMNHKKRIDRELKQFGDIPLAEALKKRRNQRRNRRRHRAGIPMRNK